jgi:hypothetical protein
MRRVLAVLMGLGLVLGAVACGDDDGGDAAPADDTTTTTDDDGGDTTDDDGGDTTDDGGDVTTTDDGDDTTDDDTTDDGGDGGGTVDPCELITLEDVQAAVPSAGDLEQETAASTCSYTSIDPFTVVTIVLQQDALDGTSFEDALSMASDMMDGELTPVEGLGDDAASLSGSFPMLFVATGDTMLTVSVLADDDSDTAQRELAEVALSRL